jgi:NAD(P)-dependent dehydrogenase (short-subunit alcohol dehydrogenase family)
MVYEKMEDMAESEEGRKEQIMEKLAMVTGANGGLGKATVQALHAAQWPLVLVGRNLAELEGIIQGNACLIEADVSSPEGAKSAMDACIEKTGQPPTALAHCAGSVFLSSMHRTDPELYYECMKANVDSAFFTLSAFIQNLVKKREPASAVLVSSAAARIGIQRHEVIAAAKGAIEGLVRAAAATYSSKGIRINAIAPALMRTPATEAFFSGPNMGKQLSAQYPLGRVGSADDGAAAIAWLLSDKASWITGQVLVVDGGFSAVRPMVQS